MTELFLLSIQIFLISFLLNLVWEVNHSCLYKTCLKMKFGNCMRLLTVMSLKDGFWITLFYLISTLLFGSLNIAENYSQLIFFILLALSFSFIDEKVSINKKRWEYSRVMPTIFGVGITPLLELAVTGSISFLLIFYLF